MQVSIIVLCLSAALAQVVQDLSHVEAFIEQRKAMLKRKHRPLYHVSPPVGWINSPSGFTFFKRQYHIFYQYYPYDGAWGSMSWGHVVSDNLIDWAHYPPALEPKEYYEKNGCLAGTALVHNNYLTLFYTGNLVSHNRTIQTQNSALSADGVLFQKYLYNPTIRDAPFDRSDFRNPKVWRFRNSWYMIVGTTSKEQARLVLYTSQDLFNWRLNGTLAEAYGELGYMWEHPEFFEMDGLHVLIISVQGLQSDGYRFKNLFQTGYVVGYFNYMSGQFEDLEVSLATFNELDHGHDFYAPQTMMTTDGRRLLVAWLGMWESELEESRDGWASMLTVIRELKLTPQGHLLMTPAKELVDLRTEILEDAWYRPGEAFNAGTRSFELIVTTNTVTLDTVVKLEWNHGRHYTIGYSAEYGYVTVDRGGTDGLRRADWYPVDRIYWRIFVDSSAVEVFCGDGEVVFSSRIYPTKTLTVRVAGETQLHITQYRLRRSVGFDSNVHKHLKERVMSKYN